MKIYVVIELVEYFEYEPDCHIIFSSENKQACINYIEFMEKSKKINEDCWNYFYKIEEIQL